MVVMELVVSAPFRFVIDDLLGVGARCPGENCSFGTISIRK